MFKKVVVGISGGVDSAVAAYLLKKKGYEVLGVFMKNWDEFDEDGRCSGELDLKDAEFTCKTLGIELKQVNFVKDYWNSVFVNFLEDYQNGLTPNPDILCNKYIKFNLFHKYAKENTNCNAIATGHYALISTFEMSAATANNSNNDVQLLIPKDKLKDQTFFLSGIERKTLRQTIFPLGEYLKTEVKEIARKIGFARLANKKESTGICFIGNRKFKDFIKQYITSKPGNFIDVDTGNIVGQHNGVHQWTIGQRCRLHSCLKPYFTAQKDVQTNTIYVASGHDHPALFSNQFMTQDINWLCDDPFLKNNNGFRCRFRFQHTKPLVDCVLYKIANKNESNSYNLTVALEKPLRAVTPGQYAVFYNSNACLGSARIINATLNDEINCLRYIL